MKKMLISLLLVVAMAVPAAAKDLTVSAAASLTDAFTAIGKKFEAANPDVKILFNFAASGPLAKQIEQGAPVDVFASANPKWMNTMVEKGFIDASTRADFVKNDLVLAVPMANKAKVAKVEDLTGAAVKVVAIGTPESVPAGQYAKKYLEKHNLFGTLEKKFVFAESVRQVLDYLRRAEADAGFVYRTDAYKEKEAVAILQSLPLDEPVTYPIAVTKGAADAALARKFMEYVRSPEGMAVLEGFGFQKP
ncbi:putative molybdenum ABC transporter, periplasmic molybdate-binding protein [Megalodesulfovibrio gigas DSM 1382 = ATCC 19364]|uniref:Putative molybdenum ABC transporter, periplasmic molybdate-binding protein n=2 Tax=Megalodesulfovibrio gigas TaxID=879 RepID=T2GG10_MEGG1|nr:putative molybdenum ABC transporter, periplasmic molybdate-binding protein [Megalodesulfovibrio gigas DSM 1382 = ATCC 19364]